MGRKIEFVKEDLKEEFFTVDLDDIKELAKISLKLDPKEDITEIYGHVSALDDYFQINKEHELNEVYKNVTSSKYGKEFLCAVTEMIHIMVQESVSRLKYDAGVKKCSDILNANKIQIERKKEELKRTNNNLKR